MSSDDSDGASDPGSVGDVDVDMPEDDELNGSIEEDDNDDDAGSDDEDEDELDETDMEDREGTKKKLMANMNKEQKKILAEATKLKESHSLHLSNLCRMQMNELLAEIAIKSEHKTVVETWFRDFKKWVTGLKPIDGISIEPLEKLKRKLNIKHLPLPTRLHPTEDSNNGLFKWQAPTTIKPIGSWTTNTAVYGVSAYDVAIEMPKECFNKTDYLNHKYHIKRALYLSYLGCQLQSRGDKLRVYCPDGNLLRPILEVSLDSEASLAKPLQIRLHFIPPFHLFKSTRFDPDTNNIRYKYFFHTEQDEDEGVLSTPIYNQTILSDICMVQSHAFVQKQLSSSSGSNMNSICDAIKLLKVWLQQRHINQGYGAFSNYIITMLICYLAQKQKINATMSSYQIIRVALVHLINSDWITKGVSFGDSSQTLSHWFLQFDVVFLDSSGLINLTSCMSKYTYERVKHEAQLALNILNSSDVYGFQAIFIRDVPFSANFDHVLQIKATPQLLIKYAASEEHKPTILSASGYILPVVISSIGQVIEVGLKNRIRKIDFQIPEPPAWSLTDTNLPPVFNGYMTISIGMTVNRAQAFKLAEKCETEEDADLESFRAFWGEKSQMKRFRDGTIVEAVSFEDEKKEHPDSHICFIMLQYLLKKHMNFHITDKEVMAGVEVPLGYYLCNQLDMFDSNFRKIKCLETNGEADGLPPVKKKRRKQLTTETVSVSVDDITRQAISTLDELGKVLRDLHDLPLTITSVQGTSSILRHTNVIPTPPQAYYSSTLLTTRSSPSVHCLQIKDTIQDERKPKIPLYTEPIEVVVQLEGSGKWPDDIHAIRRLKCAFLVRIAQLLQSNFDLTVHVLPSKLYVIKDGFIFSIQLTYFRELILLKQLQGDDGILRYRDNLESLQREKSTLLLPKLSSILHSIHSQFTAFGKTCRLAKRWIASHMLLASSSSSQNQSFSDLKQPDYCLTEEAVELIVASLFVNYHPYLEPPNEAQVGFIRFLKFITTTDWRSIAIILNFNDTFTNEDISSIESDFRKRRATLPTPFIAYPDDRLHSVWTKNVLPIVWKRIIALGKQALEVMTGHFNYNCCSVSVPESQETLVDPFKTLFNPDLSHFDILIWINKNINCKKRVSVKQLICEDGESRQVQQYKEYIKPDEELIPIVNFDPVQSYLLELKQNFGHFGLFLYDTYGGEVIAFVWKPDMNKEHEFTISSVKGQVLKQSTTSSSHQVVVPHLEGLVELFVILGEGIVDKIEAVQKHDEIKMERLETEP